MGLSKLTQSVIELKDWLPLESDPLAKSSVVTLPTRSEALKDAFPTQFALEVPPFEQEPWGGKTTCVGRLGPAPRCIVPNHIVREGHIGAIGCVIDSPSRRSSDLRDLEIA